MSVLLPSDRLYVLAADFLRVEIPQQPVVIGHEAVELPVPFLWQTLVELFDEGQERALRREFLLVLVN